MDNRQLFEAALGLTDPWMIERVEFDPDAQRLDLHLGFTRGARFACPEGDETSCPVHDTVDKTWRHLDFFEHKAYLHARVPRIGCPTHGVRQIAVPWARPGSGFTLLFEALVMAMLAQMPVAAVARIVGEHDTRLWRVLHHYVGEARARRDDAGVHRIGIDETSIRRGHDYISLFVDLDARRLLYADPTMNAGSIPRFIKDLRLHGGDPEAITDVCTDLSPTFTTGVGKHLPGAQLTWDRYHITQDLGRAVDQVRRIEAKARPELKRTRYLWLKNPSRLGQRERAHLDFLLADASALATSRAYRWRLSFEAFYDLPEADAEAYLRRWCTGAVRSRLGPIIDFAQRIMANHGRVLRWHVSRLTNGLLEGLNSLIQAAKRRARGYRTRANLIAMSYLIAGKLELGISWR